MTWWSYGMTPTFPACSGIMGDMIHITLKGRIGLWPSGIVTPAPPHRIFPFMGNSAILSQSWAIHTCITVKMKDMPPLLGGLGLYLRQEEHPSLWDKDVYLSYPDGSAYSCQVATNPVFTFNRIQHATTRCCVVYSFGTFWLPALLSHSVSQRVRFIIGKKGEFCCSFYLPSSWFYV